MSVSEKNHNTSADGAQDEQDPRATMGAENSQRALISCLITPMGADAWEYLQTSGLRHQHFTGVYQTIFRAIEAVGPSMPSILDWLDRQAASSSPMAREDASAAKSEIWAIHNDDTQDGFLKKRWIDDIKQAFALRMFYESGNLMVRLSGNPHLDAASEAERIIGALQTIFDAAQPAEQRQRFRFMSSSEIEDRPPMEWLISKVLPRRGTSALWGEYGTGKSFAALDLACSVAMGYGWRGHPIKAPGAVAYISAEGIDGMQLRKRAWRGAHNLPKNEPERLYMLGDAPQLLDTNDLQELLSAIDALPETPALIIIDTLARCAAGSDENSQKDMGLFVKAMDTLKTRYNAQVMVIHHANNQGNVRGSSVLPGACETMIQVKQGLSKETKQDIELSCFKQKDGAAPFETIKLRLHQVVMGDTGELSTCILVDRDATEETPGAQKVSPNQSKALKALLDGPLGWQEWLDISGVARGSFQRTINELINSGYAQQEEDKYTLTEAGKLLVSQVSNKYHDTDDTPRYQVSQVSPPYRGDTVIPVIPGNMKPKEIPLPASDTRALRNEYPTDGATAKQPETAPIIDFKERMSNPKLQAVKVTPTAPDDAIAWLRNYAAEKNYNQRVRHAGLVYGEGDTPAARRDSWEKRLAAIDNLTARLMVEAIKQRQVIR